MAKKMSELQDNSLETKDELMVSPIAPTATEIEQIRRGEISGLIDYLSRATGSTITIV